MADSPAYELHELFDGRLTLYQPVGGYRFSIDALLLASFAGSRCSGAVADLGTGCGILPVLLARNGAITRILGIEIQPELADLARRNIELNGCGNKAEILCGDIRAILHPAGPEHFDAVVSNPPFYRAGCGRINPHSQKAAARHELQGTIADFMSACAGLLRQAGQCAVVYSAARLADLLDAMRINRLEPKVLRFVHARKDEPATMVLAEAVKGGGAHMRIEPPLVLYSEKSRYSAETLELFANL